MLTAVQSILGYRILQRSDIFERDIRPEKKVFLFLMVLLIIQNMFFFWKMSLLQAIVSGMVGWILLMIGYIDERTGFIWRFFSFPVIFTGIGCYLSGGFQGGIDSYFAAGPVICLVYMIFGWAGIWGIGDCLVLSGLALYFFGIAGLPRGLCMIAIHFFFSESVYIVRNIKKIFRNRKVRCPFAIYIYIGYLAVMLLFSFRIL